MAFLHRKPTATILPTVEIQAQKPAPVVAVFSSRGPAQITENIIKVIISNLHYFYPLISATSFLGITYDHFIFWG